MEMTERHVVTIAEQSQVGEARRLAQHLARSLGFDEGDAGRVGIAVTEAGTNIVKHGGGGQMLLRAGAAGGGLIALDIFSAPGLGTVIVAEFRRRASSALENGLRVGGVSVPKRGEEECGDGWA